MRLTATKSTLRGQVAIPGSKSHTIRAVTLASLASGDSLILDPLVSADTLAAVHCYSMLGAQLDCRDDHCWRVKGFAAHPRIPDNVIDVANSGTTLRFALGTASLLPDGAALFTGDHQIRQRPAGPLLHSLNDLGAHCFSTRNNGCAPFVVRGPLTGGKTDIEAISSQYLSSLLLHAPLAPQDTTIHVIKLNERPYVEMTLRYLSEQGIDFINEDFGRFLIKGGQSYQPFRKSIPADFSSATFFLCAGALLDADLTLDGLDFLDTQGDKHVVDVLQKMGANITIEANKVHIRPQALKGVDVDLNAMPDSLPALAVTACFAQGKSSFFNVAQARLKETDRIAVMAAELRKLGAHIDERPDGLDITPQPLHAADLAGHDDHRVVMALALAGLALPGHTTIDSAEAINVTFANYIDLMQSVGANLHWQKTQ